MYSLAVDGVRQLLDLHGMAADRHERHTGNLPHAALELLVAGRDDVAPVLGDPLHETVVGIDTAMLAHQSLDAGIARCPGNEWVIDDARLLNDDDMAVLDRDSVTLAHLLEFAHDAVGDVQVACK